MKAAIVAALLLVMPFMALPSQALEIGRAPVLDVSFDSTSRDVTTNGTAASSALSGTATVTMGALDRNTYTLSLTASAEAGFAVSVSPNTMTFSDTGTQSFCCTVAIPAMPPGNASATITVQGDLRGGGFSVSDSASCQLNIVVSAPSNDSSGQGPGSRNQAANTSSMAYAAGAVVVIAAIAGAVYYLRIVKGRKTNQE